MAYTALYRKKRPRNFSGVIGQPHVVRTLKNQLAAGHISHAYLFCGTRGTGKTSAAKIFSRAVNCVNPQDGEPCNECEICTGILSERNMNVIEIDAASNNGVENIRDLREEVKYPPTEGRYRVYIIDEAHMLTTSAFNALLKTLEEPPAHVVFILATTDPQKIPATILSRCQRYDFKRLTVPDITETIQKYLTDEDADVEEEAIRYIASVSDGAMRDALSILDQCLSYYGGECVTLSKVLTLLGAVDRKVLFDFVDALSAFDSGRTLGIIDQVVRDGRDLGQFTADVLRHLRDLLVASQITGLELLEHSEEAAARIKSQSGLMACETWIEYIRAFSELQNELRYSTQARMALEVCAIRLCHPETSNRDESIFARLARLEQALAAPAGVVVPTPPVFSTPPVAETVVVEARSVKTIDPVNAPEPAKAPAPVKMQEEEKVAADSSASTVSTAPGVEVIKDIQKNWPAFCGEFKPPLKSMLLRCGIEAYNGMLRIVCDNEAGIKIVKDKQTAVQEKLMARFGLAAAPNLAFAVREDYNIPQNATQDTVQRGSQTSKAAPTAPAAPADDDWAAFGEQVDMDAAW